MVKENKHKDIDPYDEENWEDDYSSTVKFQTLKIEGKEFEIDTNQFSSGLQFTDRYPIITNRDFTVTFKNPLDKEKFLEFFSFHQYNFTNSRYSRPFKKDLVIENYNKEGYLIQRINVYYAFVRSYENATVTLIYDYFENIYF